MSFPKRIICLTEESVETIYLLGMEHLIVGVSAFVSRPAAAKKIQRVSGFTSANIEKIVALRPDLVLGFSDIQKDIAKELIGLGINVFISNQRSLKEILDYISLLGRIIDKQDKSERLVTDYQKKIHKFQELAHEIPKIKIYLEEWDRPMISGIKWFSEIFEVCGAENIFQEKAKSSLAKNRFVSGEQVIKENPDVIIACWCGKKVDISSIKERSGFQSINAIKNNHIYELDPGIFLQPGPALFEQGLDIAYTLLKKIGDNFVLN